MKKINDIGWARAELAKSLGLDLTKSFFELNSEEIDKLEFHKKVCNFRGRNYLGRSPLRQFWYHLQKNNERLPF